MTSQRRWVSGAMLVVLAGCVPDAPAPDAATRDASATDLGLQPDAGSAGDRGAPDQDLGDAVVPGTPGVEGRICAPAGDFYVADAEVVVRWLEPRGQDAVLLSRHARSGPGGVFRLRDLPTTRLTFVASFGRLHLQFEAEVLAPGASGTLENGLTDVGDRCFAGDQVKLAVVGGVFDSVETVIDELGFTDVTLYGDDANWHVSFFDPALLAQYDALYFNCGLDDEGLDYAAAAVALRSYAAQGGSIYASDWAYDLIEQAWPEQIDFLLTDATLHDALLGATGEVQAELHGSAVTKTCGRQALIDFDLPYWAVMERTGGDTELLASGAITAYADADDWDPVLALDDAPLMVRFTPQQAPAGVVFTSFHNEAQATDDMLCILKTIILSL